MHVSGLSSGSFSAVVAGLRAQMKAQTMQVALGNAGMLPPELAAGLDMLLQEGAAVTEAGIEAAKIELVGATIDILA